MPPIQEYLSEPFVLTGGKGQESTVVLWLANGRRLLGHDRLRQRLTNFQVRPVARARRTHVDNDVMDD